jgi:hypothetical protein
LLPDDTGVGRTGVVGVLANGRGPTVLLRADMDALPVLERTGLDYASTERGTGADGTEVPVMHACGQARAIVAALPSNHSPLFAPVIEPTLRTGIAALTSAARAWLAPSG